MRQRLDLDTMLRKYESNYSSGQLRKEKPYIVPNVQNKLKIHKQKTQANYYPENDYQYYQTVSNKMQTPYQTQRSQTRDKVNSVTFQMSKSECQKLLRGIRQQLKLEEREIQGHIQKGISELKQRFQSQHEQIRRQLINLVDHSLQINKRQMMELLQGYRKQYPVEYVGSKRKMQGIDQQINRLLNGLNSIEFKKVIAQIVTKDFSEILKTIREDTKYAHKAYKDNLQIVQIDKSAIGRIKENLQHIYHWRSVQAEPRYLEDKERNMKTSRSSSKKKIFEPRNGNNRLTMTHNDQGKQRSMPKSMRRSFFNFDNKYE